MTTSWRKPPCGTGKAAYRTQGLALRALETLRRENAQAVAPMAFTLRSAYRCRECGAWHLTTKSNGVRVGRERAA